MRFENLSRYLSLLPALLIALLLLEPIAGLALQQMSRIGGDRFWGKVRQEQERTFYSCFNLTIKN